MENCLFCKIIAGDIPSDQVYEDGECFAFRDINPQAPVHVLVIPKRHIASHAQVQPGDAPMLGRMLALAPRLMQQLGVVNGFRVVVNTGRDGGQEVDHLHVHVMGGPRPWLKG